MVTGAVVAVIGSLVGTTAALWKAIEAAQERDNARMDTISATRISNILQSVLASVASQRTDAEGDYRLGRVLDGAWQRAQDELGDDPDVEATIRQKLAHAYLAIGDLDSAGVHLRAAWEMWRTRHGDGDKDSVCILTDLVKVRLEQGRIAEAETAIRNILPKAEAELGSHHPYVAQLRDHLTALGRANAGGGGEDR